MTIKVCSCKDGFRDSPIITLKYKVMTEENRVKEKLYKYKPKITQDDQGLIRGDKIESNQEQYRPLTISLNDDSESINTSNPGSMRQASLHRRYDYYFILGNQ